LKLRSHKTKAVIFLYLLFSCFALCLEASPATTKLAIAYSDSLRSTLRTVKGIKSAIVKHYPETVFHEYLLTSSKEGNEARVEEIKSLSPKLIITVGSYATQVISDRIKDRPVIFSAVLNPETSEFVKTLDNPGGNMTGASLDIPSDIQFKYLKRVIKNLKKVGVLYTNETENLIPPARAVASGLGLKLYASKIESEKDIPIALDSLNRIVDAFWSVADGRIYSPRSTRFILLNTLRNSKPFMGFSSNLVESGALFGLDYDYKDIGRQAGKIACEVLSGKSPASIPVAVPGIIWFHYNEKTAEHIQIEIPEDLAAVAKEVYR
jgi:putative ABC transport system substrate-binding protein